jgi:hypothetical protein
MSNEHSAKIIQDALIHFGIKCQCETCTKEISDYVASLSTTTNEHSAGKVHELKTWPEYFEMIFTGKKTFEVRKNDRGFQVGDILHLREYSMKTLSYTGRECKREITYILYGGEWGISENTVILALQQLSQEPQQTGWVSVEERLPEISEVVLVETHHFDNSNGNRVLIIETFVGYMDEYGDLYSKPTDDNYGWQFNDVVKRWQPLPAPPQQTIHSPENKEK